MTRRVDRRAAMQRWALDVNAAASDPAALAALAASPAGVAIAESAGDGSRVAAFAHGYVQGALESADGSARIADPDAIRHSLRVVDATHDADPPRAAAALGVLLGSLWGPIVTDSIDVGSTLRALLEGIQEFDPALPEPNAHEVLVLGGSGKRRREMPAITTAATILATFVLASESDDALIVKPLSGGTTYATGSVEAVEQLGCRVGVDYRCNGVRLRFERCEHRLPRFARVYHGLTFAPTALSLCAPAIAASGVLPTAAFYGLTDGPADMCAALLAHAYGARALVLSGRDPSGRPLVDEPSPIGPTDWAFVTQDHEVTGRWYPTPDGVWPAEKGASIHSLLGGAAPAQWLEIVVHEAALAVALARGPLDCANLPRMRHAVADAHSSNDLIRFVETLVAAPSRSGPQPHIYCDRVERRAAVTEDQEKIKRSKKAGVGETGAEADDQQVSAQVRQGETSPPETADE